MADRQVVGFLSFSYISLICPGYWVDVGMRMNVRLYAPRVSTIISKLPVSRTASLSVEPYGLRQCLMLCGYVVGCDNCS